MCLLLVLLALLRTGCILDPAVALRACRQLFFAGGFDPLCSGPHAAQQLGTRSGASSMSTPASLCARAIRRSDRGANESYGFRLPAFERPDFYARSKSKMAERRTDEVGRAEHRANSTAITNAC